MLEGNAQFLGSRVFAMPGGLQRILLLLDERDERLAAVVDETGRHFDSERGSSTNVTWMSCQLVLWLAAALTAGDSGIDSGSRRALRGSWIRPRHPGRRLPVRPRGWPSQ
jgi:hypothetical protein